MKLTRYEHETIINFNEGEKTASVYTNNKALIKKLKQLSEERPTECRLVRIIHWGQAMEYTIPKSWVKINPSRILSVEQRAALAERLRSNLASKAPITIEDSE